MANQLFIETCGDSPASTVVRIKRQVDRLFYDAADGKFKAESSCKNPWVVLAPSKSMNSTDVQEVAVSMNTPDWTDGDYLIYYHDNSRADRPIFWMGEFSVFDRETWTRRVPTSTEIAGRVLDATVASHKAAGSVGAWMLEVSQQLKAIKTKLGIS